MGIHFTIATFVRNRTLTSSKKNRKMPQEILDAHPTFDPPHLRKKIASLRLFSRYDPKSRACIIFGVADIMKACIFEEISSSKRFVSRDWRTSCEIDSILAKGSDDQTPDRQE